MDKRRPSLLVEWCHFWSSGPYLHERFWPRYSWKHAGGGLFSSRCSQVSPIALMAMCGFCWAAWVVWSTGGFWNHPAALCSDKLPAILFDIVLFGLRACGSHCDSWNMLSSQQSWWDGPCARVDRRPMPTISFNTFGRITTSSWLMTCARCLGLRCFN